MTKIDVETYYSENYEEGNGVVFQPKFNHDVCFRRLRNPDYYDYDVYCPHEGCKSWNKDGEGCKNLIPIQHSIQIRGLIQHFNQQRKYKKRYCGECIHFHGTCTPQMGYQGNDHRPQCKEFMKKRERHKCQMCGSHPHTHRSGYKAQDMRLWKYCWIRCENVCSKCCLEECEHREDCHHPVIHQTFGDMTYRGELHFIEHPEELKDNPFRVLITWSGLVEYAMLGMKDILDRKTEKHINKLSRRGGSGNKY